MVLIHHLRTPLGVLAFKQIIKGPGGNVNRSGNTISYNVLDWEIEDSNGVIQSTLSAAFASADDDLGSGQLAKDGKKSGSLVFEIPSGDTNLKLHYRPSLLSSDELIINL